MASSEIDVGAVVAHLSAAVGGRVPDVGVVCGSGLASLSEGVANKVVIPYKDVPTYPAPTVQGHVGEFVFGEIGDKFVVLLRGRLHFYEGHAPATIAAQIRVFAGLGVKAVVVTNAAGSVNPTFAVGDFMAITDHLNVPGMAGNHPLVGPNLPAFGPRFPPLNGVYNAGLLATLREAAAAEGVAERLRSGVYCGLSGPTYESPAEIGALRVLGGDTVGMSTVPEVVAAAHAGLAVLGVSLVTNKCLGPGDDASEAPSHAEVMREAKAATAPMTAMVQRAIGMMQLAELPRSPAFGKDLSAPVSAPEAADAATPPAPWLLLVAAVAAGAAAGAAAGWLAGAASSKRAA